MGAKCGFTGCKRKALYTCPYCGLPLCETHSVRGDGLGDPEHYYCRHCYAYLMDKTGHKESSISEGRVSHANR